MAETQKLDGEAVALLIHEGLADASDDALREMAEAMLGKPVRIIGDNQFEIDW